MPNFDVGGKETGGRERRYAGLQILRQLKRKGAEAYTVVVTQFEQFGEGDQLVTLDELRRNLMAEFTEFHLGAIYYQAADSRWRDELRHAIVSWGCAAKGANSVAMAWRSAWTGLPLEPLTA
ncbi:MAG TPA: hypothetical protein VN688_14775 [Gemmataceae bacterium]|nr:hypothetical protein [Gemmataceae bacterium]